MNTSSSGKLLALGFGFGKEARIYKQLSLNAEINSRYLYQGNWSDTNLLNRLDLNLSYKVARWLALTSGPAVNILYSNQVSPVENYDFVWNNQQGFSFSNPQFKGWIGWHFGLVVFK